MKRTLSLCCAALLSCLMTCPALAADALLLTPSLYPTEVKEYANGEEMRLMGLAYDVLNLTARSYHRILKVARTIADLDYSEEIKLEHLQEAIGYRTLDRKYWGRYV